MRAPTQKGVFNSLAYSTVLLVVVVLACLAWAFQFERPFLYYVNLPFPAVPTVHAGQSVELAVERCNRSHSRRSYMTTHNLRNETTGTVQILPDVWVDIEPGCTSSVSRVNVVPRSTAPGVYIVYGVAQAEGLVMTHRVQWYSRPFQVLPAVPDKEK